MKSKIEYGFRGEDITYRSLNKSIQVGFSWVNGARLYSETIDKWEDGSNLTAEEKKRVFNEIVRFVGKNREKPIIVINIDDPSQALWEDVCSINEILINKVEYTSKEEQYQFERDMYLELIIAGKIVNIDGIDYTTFSPSKCSR